MVKLKMEEEQYQGTVTDDVKKGQTKVHQLPGEEVGPLLDLDVEQETVKVDLRLSEQVPTNRCVYERYGRKPCGGDDEDDDTENLRQNIKEESQRILLNKGGMRSTSILGECGTQGERYVKEEEELSSKE